jgi:aminotransferase
MANSTWETIPGQALKHNKNKFYKGDSMIDFINPRVTGLKPSGIRKYFDIALTMDDVISLGLGEPDFTTPQPIVEAGIRALKEGATHYTANLGLLELRQELGAHLDKLYKVNYAPDEIIITVGVSEALYLTCTAILQPGDEVIIPTPAFVSYEPEVKLAGGVVVEVATYEENLFVPKIEDIAAAITDKTKAIVLTYPNNPTGAVASRETLLQIAELAQKHNFLVIADEVYDRLVYGQEHVCFSALPGMKERTILLGGWSKSYAMTGWRLGYACSHREIISAMVRVHQFSVMCAPIMAQYAGLEALRVGEPYVLEMVAEYDRRRKLIVDGFNTLNMPTFEPKGAFYCFPRISGFGVSDEEFCMGLLKEEGVVIVPGDSFGDAGIGFARASYATSYEQIEKALERIARYIKKFG